MASGKRKSGAMLRGILLGVAAAMVVTVAHGLGLDERAELVTLDWRFRNLPTIAPSERIVNVDLDDPSLEQLGRWPWPRRRLAQLVDTLADGGAAAVALDIILPLPQEPRYVKEELTGLYKADTAANLNADAPPVLVLDDVELAEAFARHRNLFVSMHVDLVDKSDEGKQDRALAAVETLVTTRPAMARAALAEELPSNPSVEGWVSTAKERVFDRRIGQMLKQRPALSLEQANRELLGSAPAGSEDFETLRRAYLRQRALAGMRRFSLQVDPAEQAALRPGRMVPPLVTLANMMSHTGFVTVMPDPDGVIRRIPLVVRTPQGAFPQLALALAVDELGRTHQGVVAASFEKSRIVIACGDASLYAIPLDSDGCMLINWAKADAAGHSNRHIPALAAAAVWQARDQLDRNRDLVRAACLEIVRLLSDPKGPPHVLQELYAGIDRAWSGLQQARWQRQRALLFDPPAAKAVPANLTAELAEMEKTLDGECAKLLDELDSFYLPTAAGAASMPAEDASRVANVRALRGVVAEAQREAPAIRKRLDQARDALRKEIAGKICLVGSTATGAADFVPTPIGQRTPGVVVHSNILNTILAGKYVRAQSPWLAAMLVLLAGVLIALFASSRGPIISAGFLLAASLGYLAIAGGLWQLRTVWLVAVATVASMFLVFAVITTYRQLTEQRRRRQITSIFKQYVSPAVVDLVADNPALAGLGGQQRRISNFFSDLAGFTTLSEKLGAEGTVRLLNRYLDRAGDILVGRYEGTLSKYEGDAMFVFFGAPVPQADHAARAISAALDCQAFLPEFNRQMAREGLLPEAASLGARMGITTGDAFVGNMGSTQKVAYTAIGDVVNLAARLEGANKFFGSRVMVNREAWQSGGDGIIGRPLGKILVVGKTEPVEAYEPLARADQADAQTGGRMADTLRRLIDEFTPGVEKYAAGDFAAAKAHFEAVLTVRDDGPARAYLRLCEIALADPAFRADFNGVIQLTEK